LWNNAKINDKQTSHSNNSRRRNEARSPNLHRKSLERDSFHFDSIMGKKKSHNLSLDSPRKVNLTSSDKDALLQSLHAATAFPDGAVAEDQFNLAPGKSAKFQSHNN